MELEDVINMRRTIRKFKDREVSLEDINKIIDSALLAPSPKNRQPWKFFIINDEQKSNIVKMMYEWDKNNRHGKTSVKGSTNQISQSNRCIIIYRDKPEKNIHYDRNKTDILAIGAAIENMSLKCTDLGLGSCWVCDTLYIQDEINQYLRVEDMEQISLLAIGYPEEIPERRKRFSRENLIIS